jgi:hypothetical protein
MPGFEKLGDNGGPDVAGRSGDEYPHGDTSCFRQGHRCDVLHRRISGGAGGETHYEAGLAAELGYVEAQRA